MAALTRDALAGHNPDARGSSGTDLIALAAEIADFASRDAYTGVSIDAARTTFLLTNAQIPMLENSHPQPEFLMPPNGKSGTG